MANTGRRFAIEKTFKTLLPTQVVLDFVEYLALRKEDCYRKLLQTVDQTETSLLVGELKAYQKLLDLFSNNSSLPVVGTATNIRNAQELPL